MRSAYHKISTTNPEICTAEIILSETDFKFARTPTLPEPSNLSRGILFLLLLLLSFVWGSLACSQRSLKLISFFIFITCIGPNSGRFKFRGRCQVLRQSRFVFKFCCGVPMSRLPYPSEKEGRISQKRRFDIIIGLRHKQFDLFLSFDFSAVHNFLFFSFFL